MARKQLFRIIQSNPLQTRYLSDAFIRNWLNKPQSQLFHAEKDDLESKIDDLTMIGKLFWYGILFPLFFFWFINICANMNSSFSAIVVQKYSTAC